MGVSLMRNSVMSFAFDALVAVLLLARRALLTDSQSTGHGSELVVVVVADSSRMIISCLFDQPKQARLKHRERYKCLQV